MKLKNLTKEQRAAIEADEVGKELLELINDLRWNNNYCSDYELPRIKSEIKRTIKLIDEEILWNDGLLFRIEELTDIKKSLIIRNVEIKKQKQLYELMEKLE